MQSNNQSTTSINIIPYISYNKTYQHISIIYMLCICYVCIYIFMYCIQLHYIYQQVYIYVLVDIFVLMYVLAVNVCISMCIYVYMFISVQYVCMCAFMYICLCVLSYILFLSLSIYKLIYKFSVVYIFFNPRQSRFYYLQHSYSSDIPHLISKHQINQINQI